MDTQKITYFDDLVIYSMARKALLVPLRSSINLVDNWYSLNFIRRGNLILRRNKVMVPLTGPFLFWERPGVEYQSLRESNELRPYEQYWIDCGGRRAKRIVEALEKSMPTGYLQLNSSEPFTSLFRSMLKDFHLDEERYHGRIVATLEQILWHMLRMQLAIEREEFNRDSITRIAEDIRFNPFQDFDFHKIAESFTISYDHFRRSFRKQMMYPPHEYVMKQRILQATNMLTIHRLRIKEVADACGFDSISSFSRTFRKQLGVSPRSWTQNSILNSEPEKIQPLELSVENPPILLSRKHRKLAIFSQKNRFYFKGEPEKKNKPSGKRTSDFQ